MIMDKMDGTGEQGQRGVHALACAVAFSSPFWFLERPLICEFVRLYANILAYFEKNCFFRRRGWRMRERLVQRRGWLTDRPFLTLARMIRCKWLISRL